MRVPGRFLTDSEVRCVEDAVASAEKKTSAEIKLVIARHCWDTLERKAAYIFHKLSLEKTRQRNCVLFLIITTNREFLIHADEGIHSRVGQAFWEDVRDRVQECFKAGRICEGICRGIERIAEKVAEHFPWTSQDRNEISDHVAFEE